MSMFGSFFKGSGLASYGVGCELKAFPDGGADNALATRAWKVHAGKRNGGSGDGESACVMRLTRSRGDESSIRVKSAKAAFATTKRLRHPHTLRFVEGACDGDGEVLLVTDECETLADWLKRSALEDEEEGGVDARNLAWGIYCVLEALDFIHKSGQVHGNVTADSIYVTNAGDWKLWGFELLTHLEPKLSGAADASLAFFRANEHLVPSAYRAPERDQRDWDAMARNKVGAADVWALAEVIDVAYSSSAPNNQKKKPPRELEVWTRRMRSSDATKRPTAEQVLRGCPLFRQAFLKELVALQNLSATSLEDQVVFYKKLDEETSRQLTDGSPSKGALDETLWHGACVHKLLPRILATIDIALTRPAASRGDVLTEESRAVVVAALPLLVQIVEMVTTKNKEKKKEPEATMSSSSSSSTLVEAAEAKAVGKIVEALELVLVLKDPVVRLEALRRVAPLVPLLSDAFINRKLFDALLLGFGDAHDDTRLATLMAMLAVAPKLNEKNRTDRLLRVVKRLEADRAAKIRTNVLIFYGRLCPDLAEQHRVKVVLPALLKALDDAVPHVRTAAVRALGACRDLFNQPQLAARHIAPKLVPLMLDPAEPVRAAAAPCVEAYLSLLRDEAEVINAKDRDRARQLAAVQARQAHEAANHQPPKSNFAELLPSKAAAQPPLQAHPAGRPPPPPPPPGGAQQQQQQQQGSSSGWASWALNKVISTEEEPEVEAPASSRRSGAPPAGWDAPPKPPAPATTGWGQAPKEPSLKGPSAPQSLAAPPAADGWGDDDAPPPPPKPTAKPPQDDDDGWGDDGWADDDAPVRKAAAASDAEKKRAQRKAELDARRKARQAATGAKPAAAPAPAPTAKSPAILSLKGKMSTNKANATATPARPAPAKKEPTITKLPVDMNDGWDF